MLENLLVFFPKADNHLFSLKAIINLVIQASGDSEPTSLPSQGPFLKLIIFLFSVEFYTSIIHI